MEQLAAQRGDLLQQRDRLQTHLEQLRVELETLGTERTVALEHVRAIEDRAHLHVDEARQELKMLQQRLEREQREHDKRITQLVTQQDALRKALQDSERATAHQLGRVAALEAAMAKWRSIPVAPIKNVARKSQSEAKTKPRSRARKGRS
ncbi:hypothetical protein [Dyella humi]|uniref:KfrA N-terminal DNA-binding domain-containing protein n=1 Tax=Dyella humi TaxID=1770547 RepID=A0ABW8IDB8_9GAMM